MFKTSQLPVLKHSSLIASVVCSLTMVSSATFAAHPLSSLSLGNSEVRTYNGENNNQSNPDYGKAETELLRMAPNGYGDGISTPAGSSRPSARLISNEIFAQSADAFNDKSASDFLWLWGQFVDHDIDLTPTTEDEDFFIPVPAGDPHFDPDNTGAEEIPLFRSFYNVNASGSREQMNMITTFIDASNVYGSDEERANALRSFKKGKLKGGFFLPRNKKGLENAGGENRKFFLAGDVRANEQVGLTALHTLFYREHNRLAKKIARKNKNLSDEEIYQIVRKIIGAYMQVITYKEFLPLLLGPNAIPAYTGYKPNVNPSISNEFSSAAFRCGHSMLSPQLLRVNKKDKVVSEISLKDAFFLPRLIYKNGGVTTLMKGASIQKAQAIDTQVVDGVRNFLFGEPGMGGFDLVSLNIQRGRDHGLPDYNTARVTFGLPAVTNFNEITSNSTVAQKLQSLYGNVNDIDLWVGGLAEDHAPGALVGPTFKAIIVDQFSRLRDGDRFWYQNDSFFLDNPDILSSVENITLSKIIIRNTALSKKDIQEEVFKVQ